MLNHVITAIVDAMQMVTVSLQLLQQIVIAIVKLLIFAKVAYSKYLHQQVVSMVPANQDLVQDQKTLKDLR